MTKYLILIALILMVGCQEAFIPDTKLSDQQIVVEGFIEVGEETNPTYVLITRSTPFLAEFGPSTFNDLFINNASVTVNDQSNVIQLTEVCLEDIPIEIQKAVYEALGLDADNTVLNLCVYVDLFDQIDRKIGGRYDLEVLVNDTLITATTTIPKHVPLYNFRWEDPPGEPSDTLAELNVTVDDPPGVVNFYRYLSEVNNEGLVSPFASVTDDALFAGKSFEFPLQKAENFDGDIDPNTFGYFIRGDSITIKWCNLDKAHFDFWNTLEFSRNSQGPFGSYTRVASNVNGALGVWGGYSVSVYRMEVPPK